MESVISTKMCPLCKKKNQMLKTWTETQVVGIKCAAKISATAQTIGDTVTGVNVNDIIHKTCRSDYTSRRNINKKNCHFHQKLK